VPRSTLEAQLDAAREALQTTPPDGRPLGPEDEQERCAVLEALERDFAEVAREGGMGPREARAVDDYALPKEQEAARAADVEARWQELPDPVLLYGDTALSFADTAGRRFLLPAFMRFTLRHPRSPFVLADHAAYFLTYRTPPEEVGTVLGLGPAQVLVLARFLAWYGRVRPGCPEETTAIQRWCEVVERG
jgi:hypothetical protein